MMTRLELSVNQVSGIISTVSLWPLEVTENKQALQQHQELPKTMFGEQLSKLQIAEAGPYGKAPGPKPPPPSPFAIHSKNALLVPLEDPEHAVEAWQEASAHAQSDIIDGEGDLSDFWVNNGRESAVLRRILIPFCPHLELSCSP